MNDIVDGRFLSPLDILLHHTGHIMLSDFDLAKHSGVIGGRPAAILQSELNGVIIDTFIVYDHANAHFFAYQLPLVDTKSCTANFRTNSFVGTEGWLQSHFHSSVYLIKLFFCRAQNISPLRLSETLVTPLPWIGGHWESSFTR